VEVDVEEDVEEDVDFPQGPTLATQGRPTWQLPTDLARPVLEGALVVPHALPSPTSVHEPVTTSVGGLVLRTAP